MTTELSQNEDFTVVTKGGGRIVMPDVVAEPQFDPASAYAVDAKVWYGSVQYICTTAITEPSQGQSNPTPEEDTARWSMLPTEEMAKKSEIDAALSGKLDKSGGEMTGPLTAQRFVVPNGDAGGFRLDYADFNATVHYNGAAGVYIGVKQGSSGTYYIRFQDKGGAVALAAPNPIEGNLAALDADGNAVDSGLPKDDVESLLFAQYYPEGNVKSAAEFTPGIKYDVPDEVNRTITVKPFCNTGTAENDNSDLVGRVVIPPFVDSDGNGYITDDGTRFKVVGVSGGSGVNSNDNLTAIVAPNTVTQIGDGVFENCKALASAVFPAAADIGNGAFNFCGALASISLPAATDIWVLAFNHCEALTSVSLPAATQITTGAFHACTTLASVSLPSATIIDDKMFEDCTSLASVDFGDIPRSSVPSLGLNAFSGVPTSCRIIVPDAQYDEWTASWSDLVAAGYRFLKHSEWEYARKYELEDKLDKSGGTMTNSAKISWASRPLLGAVEYSLSNNGIESEGASPSSNWVKNWRDIATVYNVYAAVQQIAPAWVSGTAYKANAFVTYNGTVYRCKVNTVSLHETPPDTGTAYWEAKPVSDLFLPLTGGKVTGDVAILNTNASEGVGIYFNVSTNAPDASPTFGAASIEIRGDVDVYPQLEITRLDTNGNVDAECVLDAWGVFYLRGPYYGDISHQIELPTNKDGVIALAAGTGHAGNLAALDADGNPTDSGIGKAAIVTNTALSGETLPADPSPEEMLDAFKKMWKALGGAVSGEALP